MMVFDLNVGVGKVKKHALRALASMPFFKQHPCCLTYFLATAQESKQRKPSLLKLLTAKNGLFLGRYECIPSSSTQMASLSFAPRTSHF
jgi:hypothetical protein